MPQDRRTFLASLGAAALGVAARDAFALESRSKVPKLGLQLYTVRDLAAADLAGVLAQIAKIGYTEVELESWYKHPATEWRDLLRANQLEAPSNHVTVEAIEKSPKTTFADNHTVGVEWLTMRELPPGRHTTVDDWKRVAARFNSAATKAKADGFNFAFHNHDDVFKPVDGLVPFDILVKDTDPSLVFFELDCYWATGGGANPVTLLGQYPGRFKMLHLKDGKPPYTEPSQTDLGKGTLDFKPILAKARGIEHWFTESDTAADPMAFAAHAYKYISNLEF